MTTETNAERLEIVRDLLEWVEIYSTENSFDALKHTLEKLTDDDHINWIIEQAERAQELEETNGLLGRQVFEYSQYWDKSKEENVRLREALENTQEQLFSIRGMNKHHDNHITGLCIEIRQALSSESTVSPAVKIIKERNNRATVIEWNGDRYTFDPGTTFRGGVRRGKQPHKGQTYKET